MNARRIAAATFAALLVLGCIWTSYDVERQFEEIRQTVETPEYRLWLEERRAAPHECRYPKAASLHANCWRKLPL